MFVIACFKREIRVSAKLKAIYCLASMRYICDANAIYTHSARMRYDINSVSRAAGTYLATGISRFHNISQIPTGIYIAEPLCGSTPLSTLHSERIIPHFSVKNHYFAPANRVWLAGAYFVLVIYQNFSI